MNIISNAMKTFSLNKPFTAFNFDFVNEHDTDEDYYCKEFIYNDTFYNNNYSMKVIYSDDETISDKYRELKYWLNNHLYEIENRCDNCFDFFNC